MLNGNRQQQGRPRSKKQADRPRGLGMSMQLLTTTVVDIFAQPEDAATLTPTNLWFVVASTSSNCRRSPHCHIIRQQHVLTLTIILAGPPRLLLAG
ncbi:hypothetical protein VTN02DRAFT_3942 [Thermoascus thermophilus]